jgi:NADPH-dependent glutamate synthase beta subunit-like oxidoreductase/NAD(P)H-flavin reductase
VQRFVAKKFNVAFGGDGLSLLKALNIDFVDIDDLEKKLAKKIFLLLESDVDNKLYKLDFDGMNMSTELQTPSSANSLSASYLFTQNSTLELGGVCNSVHMFMQLTAYAAWALYSIDGKALHKNGALFILPKKIDFQNLVNQNSIAENKNNRDGFDLTDQGFSLNRALAETNYCIFCHKQNKDSCRSGLHEKDGGIKKDSLNVELKGCPLDQKISEMNLLKSEGFSLSSLAMAIIDNPMVAGTGSRICNDCMKSCIFQKQDPVDIPQVETRVLKDVLSLPYGFEIYSLLTRWNPLNINSPLPKNNSGKKVLVCGLGPAGYTLSHYLLNEGHEVVAIDGLKIEPLHPEISGVNLDKTRCEFRPIKFLDEIYEPLSSRLIQGFGGVAEYGITVRWDKNFLKVIRLLLERRSNFSMFGGLRFGSSITEKIAFERYGFNHIAVCIGAGRPNIINLENNFARGIRQASDFLMSLQLTGAFRQDLSSNLQIRMPILVVGGGLTAVDTACEAGAYYIEQIRKFAKKTFAIGKENLFKNFSEEEKIIAEEFLTHHIELAKSSSNAEFLKKLGGVKILYRKKIQDSPAYKMNHQELEKALGEGVEFIENITPIKANLDEFGHIESLSCNEKTFDCKSLLVAAGTAPNLSPFTEDGVDYNHENISFFGDVDEKFEGNVVKAMASAKMGYKKISDQVANQQIINSQLSLREDFLVTIKQVERLSDNVVEVFVRAPLLANQTEIGHIFRLQNYHALAMQGGDKLLAMEGVAVTALSVDRVNGIISVIVVETGGSTSLIQNFRVGEPCIFMGPSGKPTEIPRNETVLLIGGGRGNQPLTALADAFRKNGCWVIFIAGYRDSKFIVRQKLMENSCDQMIFAIESGDDLKLNNPHNIVIKGTVIDAVKKYFGMNVWAGLQTPPSDKSNSNSLDKSNGSLSLGLGLEGVSNPYPPFMPSNIPSSASFDDKSSAIKIDRIFTIGNDKMMHEIAKLRHQNLIPAISDAPIAITSLNAPMQCMLKGVCSQCLQKRVNDNGEVEYFYSCMEQDQDMDRLDFEHLKARCGQNSIMEKASTLKYAKI